MEQAIIFFVGLCVGCVAMTFFRHKKILIKDGPRNKIVDYSDLKAWESEQDGNKRRI